MYVYEQETTSGEFLNAHLKNSIPYSAKFWRGEIFMDTDFKYLTENILTDGECLSLYTCKR